MISLILGFLFVSIDAIVLNEVFTRAPPPLPSWIEIYNPGEKIDISGWVISNDKGDNYTLPTNTTVTTLSFLNIYQKDYVFSLDFGDIISLYSNNGTLEDTLQVIYLKGSSGKLLTSDNVYKTVRFQYPTPEAPNSSPQLPGLAVLEVYQNILPGHFQYIYLGNNDWYSINITNWQIVIDKPQFNPTGGDPVYLGCYYQNLDNGLQTSSASMSLIDCHSYCINYPFFGMTSGDSCYCTSAPLIEPYDVCDIKCPGDNNFCGGQYGISMYTTSFTSDEWVIEIPSNIETISYYPFYLVSGAVDLSLFNAYDINANYQSYSVIFCNFDLSGVTWIEVRRINSIGKYEVIDHVDLDPPSTSSFPKATLGKSLKRRTPFASGYEPYNWALDDPFYFNTGPISCSDSSCPNLDPCIFGNLFSYYRGGNDSICTCDYYSNSNQDCSEGWPGYCQFFTVSDHSGYLVGGYELGDDGYFPTLCLWTFDVPLVTNFTIEIIDLTGVSIDWGDGINNDYNFPLDPLITTIKVIPPDSSVVVTFNDNKVGNTFLAKYTSIQAPISLSESCNKNCSQMCLNGADCWCYTGYIQNKIPYYNATSNSTEFDTTGCKKISISEDLVQVVYFPDFCAGDFSLLNFSGSGYGFRESLYEPWIPYVTAATPLGCWLDKNPPAFTLGPSEETHGVFEDPSMGVMLCALYCTQLGAPFMGIQNTTCYCTTYEAAYSAYGSAPTSECNILCPGNTVQNCGGISRNFVYKIPSFMEETGRGCILRLSTTDGGQAGAIYYNQPINLNLPFKSTLFFEIDNRNADGLTFALQNVGPNGLGGQGGNLGAYGLNALYGGDSRVFVVEVDAYQNGFSDSPTNHHIAIGYESSTGSENLENAVYLNYTVTTYDYFTAMPLYLSVEYDSNTNKIFVQFDDVTIEATFNLKSYFGNSSVWAGITCGTGGLAEIHDVISWIFEIKCDTGYIPSPDRRLCNDLNECKNDTLNDCEKICINDIGSYHCECPPGEEIINKTHCYDIDECTTNTHSCEQFCVNGLLPPDNYTCGCDSGFTINGRNCDDIDECTTNTHNCVQKCDNTIGSFNCTCFPGYNETQVNVCDDIDECVTHTHLCQQDCINSIGSYGCICNPGFNISGLYDCEDIDECSNTSLCEYFCTNTVGSYYCSCPIGFSLESDNITCAPLDCPFQWGQWSSMCTVCKGQTRNRTRIVDTKLNNGSPLCYSLTYFEEIDCAFPCVIPDVSDANAAIASLLLEWWSRSKWLSNPDYFPYVQVNDVVAAQNKIRISLTNPNTSIPCNNNPTVKNFSQTLMSSAEHILPDVDPNLISTNVNSDDQNLCLVDMSISEPESLITTYAAIGGTIGGLILVFIILFFIFWNRRIKQRNITRLPRDIQDSFFFAINGKKKESFFMRKIPTGSSEYEFLDKLLKNHLDIGKYITVENAYAVYNPNLLNSFVIYWINMTRRLEDNRSLWQNKDWINHDKELKTWVMDEYTKMVSKFAWNKDIAEPIIPMAHGTAFPIAEKICASGFAALSALDSGFYGKGIYFTDSCQYAVPYFATKRDPAIIISYVIPGHPFPTTEHRMGERSLMGAALKNGYQCHYVIVKRDGDPVVKPMEEYFSELVVNQEAQVVPAYVLRIGSENLLDLLSHYKRAIMGDPEPRLNRNNKHSLSQGEDIKDKIEKREKSKVIVVPETIKDKDIKGDNTSNEDIKEIKDDKSSSDIKDDNTSDEDIKEIKDDKNSSQDDKKNSSDEDTKDD